MRRMAGWTFMSRVEERIGVTRHYIMSDAGICSLNRRFERSAQHIAGGYINHNLISP